MSFWYELNMLGIESFSVICKRLTKIGWGGQQSLDEMSLMITEKVAAGVATGAALMSGQAPNRIVSHYRASVAANEARLS